MERTVTKIEDASRAKCKIFLDEQFAFVLYKGELSHFQLGEGAVVTEETLRKIREEILIPRAKRRALYLLNEMARTEAQLRDKLKKDGYPPEVTEAALAYVKSYGYVNDVAYIRGFVDSRRRTKSRREIAMLLEQKGLDRELTERVLDELYEEEPEGDTIRRLIEKRGWRPAQMGQKEQQKMYAYLMRKGFRYEEIRHIITEHFTEEQES